jgi:murein DD-endopeptidase MepM/ murein hydrolase activator NlpD
MPRPRPAGRGTVPDPGTAQTADWGLAEDFDWDRDWAAAQPAAAADAMPSDAVTVISAPAGDGDVAPRTPATPRARRIPRAPARRPSFLLAAVVAGALAAALFGGLAGPATPSATGHDFGLGLEAEGAFAGGADVAGARGEISQAEAQARLDEIAASRAAREPQFVVPTQGRISTCFCMRWGSMHWGLDLAAPLGTPILAAADGVVLRAGPASGYGNAIYVQDAEGNVQVYGHMRYLYVDAGDVVSAGDLIAKVGSEGQSTGPHLHFEIHQGGINGRPTDPADWLAARGASV